MMAVGGIFAPAMPRPNIGKLARRLTPDQRAEAARVVGDWAEVARVHGVLVERAAAEEKRLLSTPRSAPTYHALSLLAEDLAGMRDVLTAVVNASEPKEVARRVREEWTRWWIGLRRAYFSGWLAEYKRLGMKKPVPPEQVTALTRIFSTAPVGLGWNPPEVDVRAIVHDVTVPANAKVLAADGAVKAADAILVDHLHVSDHKLRTTKKGLGHVRIRRPRGPRDENADA